MRDGMKELISRQESAVAVGKSIGILLPENAILVTDSPTTEAALYLGTEGARAHDYLFGACGGVIGGGFPVGLGAAVACPDRKTVVFEDNREESDSGLLVIVISENAFYLIFTHFFSGCCCSICFSFCSSNIFSCSLVSLGNSIVNDSRRPQGEVPGG